MCLGWRVLEPLALVVAFALVFALALALDLALALVLAGALVGFCSSNAFACSRVSFFGSTSFGILALFGRALPFPDAGLMAGPLMYGPNGPIIILISPQSAMMLAFFCW